LIKRDTPECWLKTVQILWIIECSHWALSKNFRQQTLWTTFNLWIKIVKFPRSLNVWHYLITTYFQIGVADFLTERSTWMD
jgi:hypothetical protein